MTSKKLTAKQQELFDNLGSALRKETVTQYVANGFDNGKQAYLKACKILNKKPSKNPETSASEILSYPNVKEYLNSLMADSAVENELNAKWVLEKLQTIANRCMQEEQVMSKDGPTGEFKFDSSGANKAVELIGKHLKMFTDKIEQDTQLTVVRKTFTERR